MLFKIIRQKKYIYSIYWGENPRLSGSPQFKPMSFKGQPSIQIFDYFYAGDLSGCLYLFCSFLYLQNSPRWTYGTQETQQCSKVCDQGIKCACGRAGFLTNQPRDLSP